jgi:hypothetical protein
MITIKAEKTTARKTAGHGPEVVDLAEVVRPKRARNRPGQ